ncbi:Cell division protein FtsZ [hydrothermal vent metagenome]|uniref:Cell division protein FtsZ n=1 Tax=hydrothermal vent metagenome TaxID=652676 RepID=A0A3B0THL1_9ZZZZ
MTINLKAPNEHLDLRPKITVFGVGGAGGNAVNNMIQAGLEGVEFVVANTDNQALAMSSAERRIQMGTAITEGLGAGSRPQIGGAAAEEAMPEILDHVTGSHMAFITAGMGGGTGTGAAPVIARLAREQGILTIGVVTKPFQFEGARRMEIAEAGIEELQRHVDTLIVIPNQNLFRVANERTTFADAFAMADQVLYSGVAGVTDLMVKEGLINLDFADVKTIMQGMGKAMMGTGEASGEKRAIEAAEAAIANPLLDDVSMKGARGLLISITGGEDLTLYEVDEAATRIRQEVDPDANIILGATFDQSLEGYVRVSVVATGIDGHMAEEGVPSNLGLAPAGQDSIYAPAPLVNTRTAPNDGHGAQMTAPAEDAHGAAAQPVPSHEGEYAEAGNEGHLYKDDYAGLPPLPASPDVGADDYEADVTIRRIEVGANMASPPPAARAPQSEAPVMRHDPRQPFLPPEAHKVPGTPRMPTIEELPMPVQHQIQAQASGEVSHHGVEKQKRRAGFLERLANVGRRRGDDENLPEVAEPRLAPARRQVLASGPFSAAEQPIARPAGPMTPETNAPDAEDDQLEIPAFLRRQAN